MGIGSVIGTPFTVMSTATRHLLDANVTFGMSSDRYNARDKYRRSYTDSQRVGAGVGTALGVAVPVAAGAAWMQRGLKVPGISGHAEALASGLSKAAPGGMSQAVMRNVGRAAGIAALGVAAGVGVKKTIEITQDDGNLGAAGAAAGVIGGAVGGAAIGRRFGGRIAAMSGGLGAIAGGIAGHLGGSKIAIGEGHIGEAHTKAPQVDRSAGDRVGSFARGSFNHFNEVGPATQGISMGTAWGMNETVKNEYSNAERAGGMHGDLLAAGILGGGALAVGAGLAGMSQHAAHGVSGLRAGADIAGNVLARGPLTGAMQQLTSKGALGAGAAAVGIAGLTTYKAFQSDSDTHGARAAGIIAAGTLATTAGAAALISRTPALAGMAAAPKAANSMLIAAALIGVATSARVPLQQFYNDAKSAHAANGGIDMPVAAAATGVGAIGGGLGAFKGLSKLVPAGGVQLGKFHIPKGALVGVGTAVGAAGLGGIGLGLSATMPDLKTVGMSVAGGAAAGAAVGGLARGIGVVPGVVGGAVLGLSASALLKHDDADSARELTAI